MRSTNQFGTSTSDHAIPVSCAGGLLLFITDQRGSGLVRQFGYTQIIPAPPVDSWVLYDDINDRLIHYSDHIVPAGEVCVVPG